MIWINYLCGQILPLYGSWQTSKNTLSLFKSCEILENTSGDQLPYVAACANPADGGTRGMPAEVLQSCNPVADWVLLTSWELNNSHSYQILPSLIKLGVITKEHDYSISFLSASVTKPLKEQSINLIPFDKFSSYQKQFRVTAYLLPLLTSHESYRTVYGSIVDPVEIDEAERHLRYLVHRESLDYRKKGSSWQQIR